MAQTFAQQRREILNAYGDHIVKFSSYYKYTFTFRGGPFTVAVGGIAENTYHFSVKANKSYTIHELMKKDPITIWMDGKVVYDTNW